MKKWKAMIAMLLCIAVLAPAALAAEGDAVLARRDNVNGGGFEDYISYSAALGDMLVLIGDRAVYTWRPGEADLTEHKWNEDGTYGMYSYTSQEDEDGLLTHTSKQVLAVYSDGTDVYCVMGEQVMLEEDGYYTFEGASLSRLVLEDRTASAVPVEDSEIDWEELVEYYEDESYPRNAQQCVWQDDVLYLITYGMSDMEAYAIPTDGGYGGLLEDIPYPRAVSSYKDGKVLFMCFDYSADGNVRFVAWDPEEEEIEEVCSVEYEGYSIPSGVVYGEESGMIYYTKGGSVVALDPETGETEEVNDMPTGSGDNALMLQGGYYVFSGYDATVVRNTDPASKAEFSLKINNSHYANAINSAYYDFTNLRGDVSVSVSTDYQESARIIEAMMNQSADCDIYVLPVTDEAFDAIYSRGFMAEIKGSEKIDKLFEDLYPQIAAALSYEGVPVAVPLECYASAFGVSEIALEKMGMTVEDIPTNWCDLLDQLGDLAVRAEDCGVSLFPQYYTALEMKNQLFYLILEDYIFYMFNTDPTMGFNTEIMRKVLEKLEAVDFTAMGLPEEYREDGPVGYFGGGDTLMFELYVGATVGEMYSDYLPLLLSLDAGIEPTLKLNMAVAFINPYSENREIAVEYLECAIDSIQRAHIASLCDIEIEPQRTSYYEEALESAAQQLEELNLMLENAEEEEKQAIEDMILDGEDWLRRIEEDYWDIQPESIEWYRKNDDNIALNVGNILYGGDTYSEIYEYLEQYLAGGIGAEEMLAGFDKKLQMILLEGN